LKQLNEYKEKMDRKFDKEKLFLLLSLSEPLFFTGKVEFRNWKFLSYREYAELLKKVQISNTYDKMILEDYINFIENLVKIDEMIILSDSLMSKNDDEFLKKLIEIRFYDFYYKKKYSLLMYELYKKLSFIDSKKILISEKPEKNKYLSNHIYLNFDFSNKAKQGLIEFKIVVDDDFAIGTQVEGFCYKQYVHSNGVQDWNKAIEYSNSLDNNNLEKKWFKFNSFPNNIIIKPELGSQKGNRTLANYYSYKPDFIYKAVELKKDIKTNELIDLLVSDIKEAIKIFRITI